jgi:hypothetical protein
VVGLVGLWATTPIAMVSRARIGIGQWFRFYNERRPTGHRPRAHPAARSVALKDQNKLAGGVPKDTPFQRLRRPGRVEFDNRNNRVAVLRRKFRCCSAYTKRRTDETIEVRC